MELRLKVKVWIEDREGQPLLSLGKFELLKEIEKSGSIKEAARRLGLPYKKAHSYVKLLEQRLGKKIFVRKRGEGTRLTPEGKRLLELYSEVLKEFEELTKELEKGLRL